MYYIILDYDRGKYFDVYREKDLESLNKALNDMVKILITASHTRHEVSIEIIESESSTIRHFVRDDTKSTGPDTILKEIVK